MKKFLAISSLILIMSGCVSQAQDNNDQLRLAPPYLVIDNFFIYDETIQGDKMCAEMIEIIYELDGVTYALPCLKSDMISFVKTDTYETFSIKDIIDQNLIPLDVLVENKILFIYKENE